MSDSPFVIDPALTAIAVNFKNPEVALIADDVLPRVNVGDEKFDYDYYPPEQIFTLPDVTVGRRGGVPEVEFSAEQRTGRTLEYGLDSSIPQKDIDRAAAARARGDTSYDPEARAIEGTTHIIRLKREQRVAAVVGASASYDADKRAALTGSDKWTDPSSDPIGDILTGMDSTFIARPNIAVCSRSVFTVLRQHPRIVKAVHGNDGDAGIATKAQIADLFDLQDIFIGDAFGNTARKGQAASYARLWPNVFSVIHRSSVATNENGLPTFGITAEWRQGQVGSALMAGRYYETKKGGLRGGVVVRVGESVAEHLVAPSTGYLITGAID